MADMFNRDKAQLALEKGLIRPDQFAKMFGDATAELPPAEAPAVASAQYQAPAGPEMAPDFVPYSSQASNPLLSRMGEAMGYNPTATLADLNPFGANQVQKQESAKREQAAFEAPVNQKPIDPMKDQYALAADIERQRAEDMRALLGDYPGSDAYKMMEDGIRSQGAAMREMSREQALAYQRSMDALENYNLDDQVAKLGQKTRTDAALTELDKMTNDLASQKIDSKRLYGNMGTGDKVLASIGLILGGFGASGGGGNRAVAAMERAIDRDVADQKADYGIKKEKLGNKETLYARMLEKFKNEDAAREATKLNMLKGAELKLAELGARYQDKATQGKVAEQLGKLQLLQDQAKASFLNSMSGGDDPYKNMDESQAKRFVPGYGFAPNEKLAGQAVEVTQASDNAIANINTIISKADKAGRFDFGQNSELTKLVQLLRSESREAILGPGTVQEAERELIAEMLQDPGAFFVNRDKAKRGLAVVRDAAGRTRDQKLKSLGLRPRAQRYKTLEYDQ